jgi:hypothetical protein
MLLSYFSEKLTHFGITIDAEISYDKHNVLIIGEPLHALELVLFYSFTVVSSYHNPVTVKFKEFRILLCEHLT